MPSAKQTQAFDGELAERLKAKTKAKRDASALALSTARYVNDIPLFVQEVLGANPRPYQERVLRGLTEHRRQCVRSLHGVGKSTLASWVVLWALTCLGDDTKVIITAGSWQQLQHYFMQEVHKWVRNGSEGLARIGYPMRDGRELLQLMITLGGGRQAFCVASTDHQRMEGAHAKNLVYLLDEAKAIPEPIWDAIEGAFSNEGNDTGSTAYALAMSTPGRATGRFYDIQKRKPGYEDWGTDFISLTDAIAAGSISTEWADARRRQWGETSEMYKNRVLGEFADTDSSSLIPLAWVEAANQRWHECAGNGGGEETYMGVDVARMGDDESVFALLSGNVVEQIIAHSGNDTVQLAAKIAPYVPDVVRINVDAIGVGAGVYDILKHAHKDTDVAITAIVGSQKTRLRDDSGINRFQNLRTAMWWKLREALDPKNEPTLALPPDEMLTGELTTPLWEEIGGVIRVESKKDYKKRLGRSPDRADAVAYAYFGTIWKAPNYSDGLFAKV